MFASSLKFESSPVAPEAVEAAIAKKAAELQESRAIAYADDLQACQNCVDNGRRHLKKLRKQVDDFLADFKKLESATSAPNFVEIVKSLSLDSQRVLSVPTLTADYES